MTISGLFIKRPIMTTLVMTGILLFGIMGYRLLPVSDLPNVDFPTISVQASLPGASPETMASAVATPLEKQFSTIAGLDQMTSSSTQGGTSITLQFTLDRNIDAAAQDVQAAIAKVLRQLPQGILPPSYQKVNPADAPIIYFALTSALLPLPTLDEYAETFLTQRISTVPGVAAVNVFGSMKYAVQIRLDPQAMASRQIGIDEVAAAINNANANMPTGILWGQHKAFTVEANGQLGDAQAFRPLIVAYRDASPVRLEDIADVVDSVQNDKSASWFSGTRGIVLAIQRQPGTNTVQVATDVKTMVSQLATQLPPSVQLQTLYDRSQSIHDSVNDVKVTLFLTLCLVVMVIFLFLRNISATIIPSLALPMSIVGTFAVMYLLGYSLDNLSLMALTLSVGFVVDDAIVMLENIVRHIEMGKPVMQAALDGSGEIGFTILSMTLSLVAVFIPVLFMGGIVGRLFHEFAVTIGVAILVSGFVSLTLTPMMCSRFLRPQKEQRHGRAVPVVGAGVGTHPPGLRAQPGVGHGAATRDDGLLRRGPGRDRVAVHGGAQGVHPHRGHGPDLGHDRGRRGHRLRGHRPAPAGGGGDRQAGPERGGLHVLRVRRREHGAPVHPPQAPLAALALGRRGHPRAAAQAGARAGHPRLSPEPAGDQHRRALLEGDVPVHAAGQRHRRAVPVRGRPAEPAEPVHARPERHQRPADQEPAGQRDDRPRPRLGAGRQRDAARDGAATTPTAPARSRPS